ncbi:hypothetical protein E2C01_016012 [Portunus trituberculatus]|uniref:Uncharacterized protein n=1 Tax=Portunus trituberculatus TaxID=210409 RepID=A0A5B7DNC3_PORTR|nr:hypothetical protein [Portunus trituberculatus]
MTTPNPASECPSREGTRNVPRSDSFRDNDPRCLDTSLNYFYIKFYKIRGLRSDFQSVKHHLSSTKPHLFLTKTQLLTVAPSLFPPTFSILIFVPKLDVAQRLNLLLCPCSRIFRVFHHLTSTQ